MNKIIFFIFSCLIFGLSGCEQKIDTWSGKDVAYVDMEADSTLVSFIYINTDVDTVQVRVQVMGNIPEDQPRYVDVKVKAEIARGTIEKVESLCKDSQAAITKTYQDSTIGIVYNLGEGNGTVDLKKTALENMNLEGSLTLKEETVQLKDGKLEMPACSIAVLK